MELVGSSPALARVRDLVRKLGRTQAPVLLLGETGTGKEVVARAIHAAAGGERPFVPIDCGAMGTLLETELFGHTKGAFTGAVADKRGLLETAAGGTAFFDEIAELPLELQVKLLRVLQEKEIRAIGALGAKKANFRVIAATNRDLKREVERGAFRRDLYYRLNVVTLRLPPLRDRREDIPELVRYFLARYGRPDYRLSSALTNALLAYEWPGNVRELENCVQRMLALNSGPELDVGDLPSALAAAAPQAVPLSAPPPPAVRVRVVPMEELEHQAILDALEHTQGDRKRAARILGIGRTTLYRKLRKYNVLT